MLVCYLTFLEDLHLQIVELFEHTLVFSRKLAFLNELKCKIQFEIFGGKISTSNFNSLISSSIYIQTAITLYKSINYE